MPPLGNSRVALVIGVIAARCDSAGARSGESRLWFFVGAPGAELRPHPLPAPQAGPHFLFAQVVIAAADMTAIQDRRIIGMVFILLTKSAPERNTCAFHRWLFGSESICQRKGTLMIVVGAIVGWFFRPTR